MADGTLNTDGAASQVILRKYMSLDQGGKIQAKYIWIDGTGQQVRGKTMTLATKPTSVSDLPVWNFDGSSTGQAPGTDSEVMLHPVRYVRDPFRGGENLIVLCECRDPAGAPIPTNSRAEAAALFDAAPELEPWYGLEQEYTLFDKDPELGGRPLGFPAGGLPRPQGPYYCGVGKHNSHGRAVVEAHYRACLYAGLKISGCNAEVMPGQWEFQVGPAHGIEAGDHLVIARYFMHRICEDFGVFVSFDPKPLAGDWNGAGCHVNFSTKPMREEGGYDVILGAIEKLSGKHAEHIAAYGEGNDRRLTGKHETASIEAFTFGVANRGASVRIPRFTERDGKGYFEDRRPASNMDPYVVTALIFRTTSLEA